MTAEWANNQLHCTFLRPKRIRRRNVLSAVQRQPYAMRTGSHSTHIRHGGPQSNLLCVRGCCANAAQTRRQAPTHVAPRMTCETSSCRRPRLRPERGPQTEAQQRLQLRHREEQEWQRRVAAQRASPKSTQLRPASAPEREQTSRRGRLHQASIEVTNNTALIENPESAHRAWAAWPV